MTDNANRPTGETEPQYVPEGEDSGVDASFSPRHVADAFGVDIERVKRAFEGEFGLGADDLVDSRQAQHLAEVIIGDRPQAERDEALMELGAFTPRHDAADATVEEKQPGELSDRLRPSEEVPDLDPPAEG